MAWTNYGAVTGSSRGTLCASDSDGTKGTWQVLTASSGAHDGFWVFCAGDNSGGTNSLSHAVDISFGASGFEDDGIIAADITNGGGTDDRTAIVQFHVPIPIASGTRITARAANETSAANGPYVSILAYDGAGSVNLDEPYGSISTYGVQTPSYQGTVLAANGTPHAKGAWTEITSSTTEAIQAIALGIVWTENAAHRGAIDIGYGTGTPTVLIEGIPATLGGAQLMSGPIWGPIHLETELPTGTRLVARYQSDVSDRNASVIVYGYGPPPPPADVPAGPGTLTGAWGGYSLASAAWADNFEYNFGVPSAFDLAAQDPTKTSRFVIIAYPYDPVTGMVSTLRWAQEGPTPNLTSQWPPKVQEAINYQVTVLSGEQAFAGGAPNIGAMRVAVALNESETDMYERYIWRDADVEVYTGFDGLDEADWKLVVSRTARDISIDETGFTIQLRDPTIDLQSPIQSSTYNGAGGIGGDEGLKNTTRPVCFGSTKNITPVLIDRVNRIYQFHDQLSNAVNAVYDKGILLTSAGAVGDAIASGAPATGSYYYELARSLIRLGAEPDGTVTADVEGHVSPTLGYVDTHANICRAIAIDYTDLGVGDIDGVSFQRLAANNQGKAGYYSSNGQETAAQLMSELLPDILGFWTFSTTDLLQVGQVIAGGSAAYTIRDFEVAAEPRSEPGPVARPEITINHSRAWTVQSVDVLASGVTDAVKNFVTQQFRRVRDPSVAPDESGGIPYIRDSYFSDEASAQSELDREALLFTDDRRLWSVQVTDHFLQTRLGDNVQLIYPRWRFGSGRIGIVLGMTERSSTLISQILWWG